MKKFSHNLALEYEEDPLLRHFTTDTLEVCDKCGNFHGFEKGVTYGCSHFPLSIPEEFFHREMSSQLLEDNGILESLE